MSQPKKRTDPHSYHLAGQPVPTHMKALVVVDFNKKTLEVTQTVRFDKPGRVYLDARGQKIKGVRTFDGSRKLKYEMGPEDAVLGSRVAVTVPTDLMVMFEFETAIGAAGLQWVTPEQADSDYPVLYSQSESISGRSIFIMPDAPSVRFTFNVTLDVPKQLRGLMGAGSYIGRNETASYAQERWVMETPVPLYLCSINVGEFEYRQYDERCGVWANPRVIESAAKALEKTPDVIDGLEDLFGQYLWGRYTTIVLPQRGYPFGAMEHPCMTSMNAMLMGDAYAATRVTIHEANHSWFGNLITCKTWGDFWLNEGVTTLGEWLGIRAILGEQAMLLQIALAVEELRHNMEALEKKGQRQYTSLKTELSGIDPDAVYSRVPYTKGGLFLWKILERVGYNKMLWFLREYIKAYRFTSIDTEEFLRFAAEKLGQNVLDAVDAKTWVYGPGLPADLPNIVETARNSISEVEQCAQDGTTAPSDSATREWSSQHWLLYLAKLTRAATADLFAQLDAAHGFAGSKNGMLQYEFLRAALESRQCPVETYKDAARTFLLTYGRTLYILPLYQALCDRGRYDIAREIFGEAKPGYHPIGQERVQELLARYASKAA